MPARALNLEEVKLVAQVIQNKYQRVGGHHLANYCKLAKGGIKYAFVKDIEGMQAFTLVYGSKAEVPSGLGKILTYMPKCPTMCLGHERHLQAHAIRGCMGTNYHLSPLQKLDCELLKDITEQRSQLNGVNGEATNKDDVDPKVTLNELVAKNGFSACYSHDDARDGKFYASLKVSDANTLLITKGVGQNKKEAERAAAALMLIKNKEKIQPCKVAVDYSTRQELLRLGLELENCKQELQVVREERDDLRVIVDTLNLLPSREATDMMVALADAAVANILRLRDQLNGNNGEATNTDDLSAPLPQREKRALRKEKQKLAQRDAKKLAKDELRVLKAGKLARRKAFNENKKLRTAVKYNGGKNFGVEAMRTPNNAAQLTSMKQIRDSARYQTRGPFRGPAGALLNAMTCDDPKGAPVVPGDFMDPMPAYPNRGKYEHPVVISSVTDILPANSISLGLLDELFIKSLEYTEEDLNATRTSWLFGITDEIGTGGPPATSAVAGVWLGPTPTDLPIAQGTRQKASTQSALGPSSSRPPTWPIIEYGGGKRCVLFPWINGPINRAGTAVGSFIKLGATAPASATNYDGRDTPTYTGLNFGTVVEWSDDLTTWVAMGNIGGTAAAGGSVAPLIDTSGATFEIPGVKPPVNGLHYFRFKPYVDSIEDSATALNPGSMPMLNLTVEMGLSTADVTTGACPTGSFDLWPSRPVYDQANNYESVAGVGTWGRLSNRTPTIGKGGTVWTMQFRAKDNPLPYLNGLSISNLNSYTERDLKNGCHRFFRPANAAWLEYERTWENAADGSGKVVDSWVEAPFKQGMVVFQANVPPDPSVSPIYYQNFEFVIGFATAAQTDSISLTSMEVNVSPQAVMKAMEVLAAIPAEYENETHMKDIGKQVARFLYRNATNPGAHWYDEVADLAGVGSMLSF